MLTTRVNTWKRRAQKRVRAIISRAHTRVCGGLKRRLRRQMYFWLRVRMYVYQNRVRAYMTQCPEIDTLNCYWQALRTDMIKGVKQAQRRWEAHAMRVLQSRVHTVQRELTVLLTQVASSTLQQGIMELEKVRLRQLSQLKDPLVDLISVVNVESAQKPVTISGQPVVGLVTLQTITCIRNYLSVVNAGWEGEKSEILQTLQRKLDRTAGAKAFTVSQACKDLVTMSQGIEQRVMEDFKQSVMTEGGSAMSLMGNMRMMIVDGTLGNSSIFRRVPMVL